VRFEPIGIPGGFVVHLGWQRDARGGFVRLFDAASFAAQGLPAAFPQTSISSTDRAGTVRGLHFQRPPHAETKLVRCLRGALFDVVLDLRPGSATFRQWRGVTLQEGDALAVVIPEGCAHGLQTLSDRTDVLYHISVPHAAEHADGVRFDDPAFAIAWPRPVTIVSPRDRGWPLVGGPAAQPGGAR
jgi:dTDP-4-dehydrorhamnose 3,5-epimerase